MSVNGHILFVVFDFSDINYMKMPWRLFTEIVPLIAEKSNFRVYVLTDTNNVNVLRRLIEKNNVKMITISKPILRYPYRGLFHVMHRISMKLDIRFLIVLSGWNLGLWVKLAKKMGIPNLLLVTLLPIYELRDIVGISLDYLPSLVKFGTIRDLVYIVKLIFENILVRLSVKTLTKNVDCLKGIIVTSESSKKFFVRSGFKAYCVVPRLKLDELQCISNNRIENNDKLSLAYFGPLILARGYDIVIEKTLCEMFNVTIYSRDKLTPKIRRKLTHGNVVIVERFFRSPREVINEAKKHDLLILPFRFVVSDIPLIVLELAYSGNILVTTQYSHIERSTSPNLIILDLKQLRNPYSIARLVLLGRKMSVKPILTIDWSEAVEKLLQLLEQLNTIQ